MASRTSSDATVDAQLSERRVRGGGARRLLVVGEIPAVLRHELLDRSVELTDAVSIHEAFALLAERDFDVVAVNAGSHGIDFVNAMKEGEAEHLHTVTTLEGPRGSALFLRGVKPPKPETLDVARVRHRMTPFVVLPHDAENRIYTVVVLPPMVSLELDSKYVPLLSTLLTVNPMRLLADGRPLA